MFPVLKPPTTSLPVPSLCVSYVPSLIIRMPVPGFTAWSPHPNFTTSAKTYFHIRAQSHTSGYNLDILFGGGGTQVDPLHTCISPRLSLWIFFGSYLLRLWAILLPSIHPREMKTYEHKKDLYQNVLSSCSPFIIAPNWKKKKKS